MGIALRRFRVPGSLPPGSCAPGPLPGETRPPGQALRSFCAPVLAVQVLHSVKLDLQDKGSVIPALQVLYMVNFDLQDECSVVPAQCSEQ
ncbi:uncharacterized protein LOC124178691 isoform X5 [Neodiprion fabricii]|uniref:uncharacterized protein LOC124178691 isoform X5 n=1 Tax=Neodiprion fabricii TaxID=2872261 RepID=UPI001ED921B4|nr:uncharacterized protein LOC124178691 isoform X5 [Neodiprion fabricii]